LANGDQVTVTITDGIGCTASDGPITTTVNPLPTVTLTSSDADNTICLGEAVTFTATSATAINYEFFLNGGSDQNGASNTYSPVLADVDQVTVTVTDGNGCTASDGPITTTVNPLPTVTLTSSDADNTICLGDAVTFTATSATATNYEFFLNGVSDQNGASNTYSPVLANGDQVTVTVTDGNVCIATDGPITTTVNPLPTVTLTSSDADDEICLGDVVTFTATSATAVNYEFFLNGVSGQNGASNTYAPVLADGDQVTVTITDGNGCTASDGPITTTVNPLPTVTLTSSDADNTICLGDAVTFTATSATATNYEFFLNGVSDQNGGSNTYSPVLADGDQVTITVTDGNGCIASDGPITTTVNTPTVTLTSSDADNTICLGDAVTFTATSATAVNYDFFLNGVSDQNGAFGKWRPGNSYYNRWHRLYCQ